MPFNPPNPIASCGVCLFRLGFGYDRIARTIFGTTDRTKKRRVAKWITCRHLKRPGTSNSAYLNILRRRPKATPKSYYIPRPKIDRLTRKTAFKRKAYLRSKVWAFFKHGLCPKSIAKLVGCSRPQFRAHIQSQFTKGMRFSNYGQWHLDHIIPCKAFDLSIESQRLTCFHFSNFRPAWKTVNLRKSARIVPCQPELILDINLRKRGAPRTCPP